MKLYKDMSYIMEKINIFKVLERKKDIIMIHQSYSFLIYQK